MTAIFSFDEPSHEYRLDGERLPSVTQIIEPIRPDFSMIPPAVLEAKRAFGTAVHLACELDDLGELEDDGTDTRVMGCVKAWRKFRAALDVEVLANEHRLYHPVMRFAGTLDRLVNMATRGRITGAANWVLDIKTSDDKHPSYGVQLGGYRLLLAGQSETGPLSSDFGRLMRGMGVDDVMRGSVHLFDDGTYRFHQYLDPSDEATFIACLAIHRFKEKHA